MIKKIFKKLGKIFNKNSSPEPQEGNIYLFYSLKAENAHGCCFGTVKDNKTGKDTSVRYTVLLSEASKDHYYWDDKRLVWSGKKSDFKFERSSVLRQKHTELQFFDR